MTDLTHPFPELLAPCAIAQAAAAIHAAAAAPDYTVAEGAQLR